MWCSSCTSRTLSGGESLDSVSEHKGTRLTRSRTGHPSSLRETPSFPDFLALVHGYFQLLPNKSIYFLLLLLLLASCVWVRARVKNNKKQTTNTTKTERRSNTPRPTTSTTTAVRSKNIFSSLRVPSSSRRRRNQKDCVEDLSGKREVCAIQQNTDRGREGILCVTECTKCVLGSDFWFWCSGRTFEKGQCAKDKPEKLGELGGDALC